MLANCPHYDWSNEEDSQVEEGQVAGRAPKEEQQGQGSPKRPGTECRELEPGISV